MEAFCTLIASGLRSRSARSLTGNPVKGHELGSMVGQGVTVGVSTSVGSGVGVSVGVAVGVGVLEGTGVGEGVKVEVGEGAIVNVGRAVPAGVGVMFAVSSDSEQPAIKKAASARANIAIIAFQFRWTILYRPPLAFIGTPMSPWMQRGSL